MSYLPISLPANNGAVLLSEGNFKQWTYVSSTNPRANSVGRWVLVRATPDPNLPGGGGGSAKIDFQLGNVIRPERQSSTPDASGDLVENWKHDINFGMVTELTELPD